MADDNIEDNRPPARPIRRSSEEEVPKSSKDGQDSWGKFYVGAEAEPTDPQGQKDLWSRIEDGEGFWGKFVNHGASGPITLVALALVILLVVGIFGGLDSRSDPKIDRDRIEAITACELAVKARLKSPTTAKFSNKRAVQVGSSNTWIAGGSVDAQNSFGATIRSDYRCRVTGSQVIVEYIE